MLILTEKSKEDGIAVEKNTGRRVLQGRLAPLFPMGLILLSALLVAAGLHIFVFGASFAPSGVDGLATMLQYLSARLGFPINAGFFTLLFNLPLLLLAAFLLERRYTLYTLFYTLVFSSALFFYRAVGLYQYDVTAPGGSPLIAAIFGGALQGLTGIPLRLGGSSGGVDIIGGLWAMRLPHKNVERLISYVSYSVVALSFFVYRDLSAVALSVISVFVCERVSHSFLKAARGGFRFEIIADGQEEEIVAYITKTLHHGVSRLSVEGYRGASRTLLLSVVSYRALPPLLALLRGYEGVFYSYDEVLGVGGRFSRAKPPAAEKGVDKRQE